VVSAVCCWRQLLLLPVLPAAAGPAAAAWFCAGLLQLQLHTPRHLWWGYCHLLLMLRVLLLLRVVWLTGCHPCQNHPMLLLLLLLLTSEGTDQPGHPPPHQAAYQQQRPLYCCLTLLPQYCRQRQQKPQQHQQELLLLLLV
jgi:hypothetical protein